MMMKKHFYSIFQKILLKKNKKSHSNAIKTFKDSSNFIKFGNSCDVFRLSNNCLNDSNSYVDTCSCETNFDCQSKNLFDLSSGTSFQVENFEVFEVI